MRVKRPFSADTISWIMLSVLALMWGSSFILIKKGLIAFDPGAVGALRISSASLFLLVIAIRRIQKVQSRHIFKLLIVGFFGSLIPALLYAKAQTQIDSAVAGVMNALTPLWVIIIGIVVFRKGITLRIFFGMLIGFGGTIWLAFNGTAGKLEINYYILYIIIATMCYGINLNIIKHQLQELDAVTITSVSLSMVGPIAVGYLIIQTDFFDSMANHPFAIWSLVAICLLGILGTAVALILFNKLVQLTTAVFASSVTYLIPIVAIMWGVIDGERLTIDQIIGMILILIGVYIANRKKT